MSNERLYELLSLLDGITELEWRCLSNEINFKFHNKTQELKRNLKLSCKEDNAKVILPLSE